MNDLTYKPKTDILQRENSVELRLNIPGVKKEDLKIKLENRKLVIAGKVQLNDLKELKIEYPVGDYQRAFWVSEDVDTDSIEASLQDGVLLLKLSKTQTALPVEIEVH